VEAQARFERVVLPTLSVRSTSVVEPDTGSVDAVFTLRLSRASSHPVSVHVATADDSASAGSDYRAHRGSVRFRPGRRSALFKVSVLGDTRPEDVEKLSLEISRPKGARLRTHEASATIPENDLPAPFPVSATLTGAGEVDDPPSPNGRGDFTMTLDPTQKKISYTLTVTGMALGDSGVMPGLPMRPVGNLIAHLGEPNPPGTVSGTRHIPLGPILGIYEHPGNFSARAANPSRSEFIRGQLTRP
jgi:hypothetical protein